MEVYLDNSATTRCLPSVTDKMVEVMLEGFGNPSSMHMKGVDAEKYVKEAAARIAKTLKCTDKELIFTSGGTEANNLALIGCAIANRRAGKHLITTSIEHASVSAVMDHLEEEGFEVTRLCVDEEGHISLDELEAAIREDTILVSIMYVNNEIGAVQPIADAAALIKKKNKNTLIHVDAIQAYGKLAVYPKRLGVDLLSVSGHKFHGPKGVGFLYVKSGTKILPVIYGGGQQKGMRSGTENVPGIAGLGQAAMEVCGKLEENRNRMYDLREHFIDGIEKLADCRINGRTDRENAPHIVSVSFFGVRSEVLLHALEDRGIYVSSGSACASNKPAVSSTLKSIGVKQELLDSTIRFSFCEYNTLEEVDYTLQTLAELLPMLRKYTRH